MQTLATRIVIPITLVLALTAGATGFAVHWAVARSLEQSAQARLDTRVAWIIGSLELDDGELEMTPSTQPLNTAENWRVRTSTGKTLWTSWSHMGDDNPIVSSMKTLVFGDADALLSFPEALEGDEQNDNDKQSPERNTDFLTAYRVPGNARVELVIKVATVVGKERKVLEKTDTVLLLILPLFVLAMLALVVFIIRRETVPLTSIAGQAAVIEADSIGRSTRLAVGNARSREIAVLSRSLNGMLERLAIGLQRERNFAAAAAHELRTPVAQLKTSLEVALRRPRSPAESNVALQDALADTNRLERLIIAVLALARTVEGDDAHRESVSLREIIELFKAQDIEATVDTTVASGVQVKGLRDHIQMALYNVLDNARRYAGNSPPEVSICKDDFGNVRVRIADRGPGIPQSERKRIFQPFIRLDEVRTIIDEDESGFGLGLAIAAVAIERCGGTITCDERADGMTGAVFVVTLRCVEQT